MSGFLQKRNSSTKNDNFFSRHSHAKEGAPAPRVNAWGDESTTVQTVIGRLSPSARVTTPQTQIESKAEFESMQGVGYSRMVAGAGGEEVVAEEASDDDDDMRGTGVVGISNRRPTSSAPPGGGYAPCRVPHASEMYEFLLSPIPQGQQLLCHIKRNTKGGIKNKMFPRFVMNLDKGADFLMGAKKRKKNKTSNYLISRDSAVKKQSDMVLGKVRSNFFGTEFLLYDHGKNPKKGGGETRLEMGAITYAQNVQGNGPRKMQIVVPQVHSSGEVARFTDGEESLLNRLKDCNRDSVHQARNKLPKWDVDRNCFTMDFGGRVTMASVKNFQLVCDDNEDHVCLQFGRAGKDLFNVDIRWPMSPFQAFGICLTSLDSKIACE